MCGCVVAHLSAVAESLVRIPTPCKYCKAASAAVAASTAASAASAASAAPAASAASEQQQHVVGSWMRLRFYKILNII